LGGGFASTVDLIFQDGSLELGEWAWVSLAVIKAMYMPTKIFLGGPNEQARQWAAVVCKSLGGCPASLTFAAMALGLGEKEQQKVADYFANEAWDRRRKLSSMRYIVSWDSWGDMLYALSNAHGCGDRSAIKEMIDEFIYKAEQQFPALEFRASWVPLYSSRFGKRPVRLSAMGDNPI
jgi:hypothetical protein